MTRILLFGRDGQVGWELRRSLAPLGALTALGRTEADLEKSEVLRAAVDAANPDVIVNAAGYTSVDKAESEPELAAAVNSIAVGVLAEEAHARGALLVHYSTDYVFDGRKPGSYREDDRPNPLSVYGRTKLEGERAIQTAGCRYCIFRASWVYGRHGNNFAKTILRLAAEREELKVVGDQFGAPTSAELIADVTAQCLGLMLRCPQRYAQRVGLYHLVAAGETNWHEYASFLVVGATRRGISLKLAPHAITAIPASEYHAAAKRPANSRLDTSKLRSTFEIELPHWHIHLNHYLDELATARIS